MVYFALFIAGLVLGGLLAWKALPSIPVVNVQSHVYNPALRPFETEGYTYVSGDEVIGSFDQYMRSRWRLLSMLNSDSGIPLEHLVNNVHDSDARNYGEFSRNGIPFRLRYRVVIDGAHARELSFEP